ncbi:MAG: FlgO family outer membrane protein [Campylobacterota bacterium]|nr:FlgO family outer membrane protein [Campylobacterota bacterium]
MKRIFLILLLTFFFTGCLLKKENNDSYKFKYLHSTGVTNFSALTKNLLADLCPTILNIKKQKRRIEPLYITDFVNLNDLENHSQLGFLLSDEMKTNVTQDCNWPIFQVEFTKYLTIGKNGTKLLSRDTNDLKSRKLLQNTYGLIGTYNITQRQLILHLKLINLKNGVILKAATKRVTLTDEIINLEGKPNSFDPNSIYAPVVL